MKNISISCEFLNSFTKEVLLPEFLNNPSNSARTSIEYRNNICLLCEWMEKDFLEITKNDALKYFELLRSKYEKGKLTRKTIHVRLSCYLSFGRFIATYHPELDYKNPFIHVNRVPVDNSIPADSFPSIEEMDAIMTSAKELGLSYFVILALISRCGLSVSEAIGLSENQICMISGKMALRFKSKKDNQIPRTMLVPEDIAQILSDYISTHSLRDDAKHIFFNRHGNPMTLKNLDAAVEKIVSIALPKKEFLHRKYTAKDMRTHAIMEFRKVGIAPEKTASYVGMSELRVSCYYMTPLSAEECPANLTNYRLKV